MCLEQSERNGASMKRKMCLVLVFLLFAAGCDVDYTLEMENDEIKENIVIEFEEEDCNEDNIECRQYVEDTLRLTHSVDNYPEYDMHRFHRMLLYSSHASLQIF